MKFTILAIALTLISTNAFAPDVLKFLEVEDNGGEVQIDVCPGTYPFSITYKEVQPNVMEKGATMQLLLVGSNSERLIEKELSIETQLNGKVIDTHPVSMKDNVIEPGQENSVTYEQDIPGVIPSGNYKITIKELSDKGSVNWCIFVTFSLK